MKKITATKFKEQCLSLLERIDSEGLLITKHGKPVARVVPVEQSCGALIGKLKNQIKVSGNIMSTGIEWNAES